MIYFDNSSTTSLAPEVLAVYKQLLATTYGNPDSLHQVGRKANGLRCKVRIPLLHNLDNSTSYVGHIAYTKEVFFYENIYQNVYGLRKGV